MEHFFTLIDRINREPERRAELEEALWQTYGSERTVLALDMSGFSLSVRRDGIVAYLARIRRMQQLALPIVGRHHGEVVKCVADNLMAVFEDSHQAVLAALAMSTACRTAGQSVSIGLDHGRLLLIPGRDCYGDPVNMAYKLGEDIARADEILVTAAVAERLAPGPVYGLRAETFSISGLELAAYAILTG